MHGMKAEQFQSSQRSFLAIRMITQIPHAPLLLLLPPSAVICHGHCWHWSASCPSSQSQQSSCTCSCAATTASYGHILLLLLSLLLRIHTHGSLVVLSSHENRQQVQALQLAHSAVVLGHNGLWGAEGASDRGKDRGVKGGYIEREQYIK